MIHEAAMSHAARTLLMLLLFLKSFRWAAWWPYSTWLLAVEKAMQRAEGCKPPPASRQQGLDSGQVRTQESSMANDALMKPEIPESLRDLMKMSIEQAKRAFDTFVATSENTWKSLETTSQSARVGLTALNAKIAEITRNNAEANFALALKLAESKDINQAMDLQTQHARKQMETFVHQLEEMRDLAAQIIQDANPARTDAATNSSRPPAASSSSSSSHAPSSSYTPGGGASRAN
jgi:phasin